MVCLSFFTAFAACSLCVCLGFLWYSASSRLSKTCRLIVDSIIDPRSKCECEWLFVSFISVWLCDWQPHPMTAGCCSVPCDPELDQAENERTKAWYSILKLVQWSSQNIVTKIMFPLGSIYEKYLHFYSNKNSIIWVSSLLALFVLTYSKCYMKEVWNKSYFEMCL